MKNKKRFEISNSTLVIIAFSSVFYSRIIATTLNFPLLNLAHFGLVPFVCLITMLTDRNKNYRQNRICLSLLLGLLILLSVTIASAMWNGAGFINAIISFMMLGEPFIFLIAIGCISITPKSLMKIRGFLYVSVIINFLLAQIQKPLIDSGQLYADGLDGTDGCGGVFFVSGAGNYLSATVSFIFALHLFSKGKDAPLWQKLVALLASIWHIVFSDSKQLPLAFGVAWILLILFNWKYIGKTLRLIISFLMVLFTSIWLAQNVESFAPYTAWARPDLYGPDGLAWYAKLYSVNLIIENFQSPLNWLFGLGPGHTVSRLGAWFLRDYHSMLGPLGSTSTTIGQQSMDFVGSFWLTSGSSLFSPVFGWAGVWGDLGILGVGAYFYLGYLTWKYFGLNDILKLNLLSILVMGGIFTQMEEPGYMISVAFILGLSWQEQYIKG